MNVEKAQTGRLSFVRIPFSVATAGDGDGGIHVQTFLLSAFKLG